MYNVINELETLKPDVMRRVNQTTAKPMTQNSGWGDDWALTSKQNFPNSKITKVFFCINLNC